VLPTQAWCKALGRGHPGRPEADGAPVVNP
jgi:hypothetical protein